MTTKALDAVFENGVFRPLTPVDIAIPEGQRVRLVVETIEPSVDVLSLATHVYDGLSEEQIEEIEQIVLDRDSFFKGRPSI